MTDDDMWVPTPVTVLVNGAPLALPEKPHESTERLIGDGDKEPMYRVTVVRCLPVVCGVCSARFPSMGWQETDERQTQAYRCASTYKHGIVRGHYGSTVADMLTIELDDDWAATLPGAIDPVCDDCIQHWLDEGYARVVGERTLDGDEVRT